MFNPGRRGQIWSLLLILALAFLSYRFAFPAPREEGFDLKVGKNLLRVKVAQTFRELKKGLSGVSFLGENEGMIFVLPQGKLTCFHMKRVNLPLSLAFLDQNGIILGIEEMNPRDPDWLYVAPRKARFALEVRRGWFRKHGVTVGEPVKPEFSVLSQPGLLKRVKRKKDW